jgi:GMP synthase (glutamine-hydrolysing)
VLAIESVPESDDEVADLTNRRPDVNRIVAIARTCKPVEDLKVMPAHLTAERLDRLRCVDAIVRSISHDSGFDQTVWQFPVILIPFGTPELPDSVVLRPVDSVDGMTARAVRLPSNLLARLVHELMAVERIAGVFCDLTNKPPATIEWE